MGSLTKPERGKLEPPALYPRRPTIAQDRARAQVQDIFLTSYRTHGTIYHAAADAGISRETHYAWLRDDPNYAELWAQAQEDSIESLLHEAIRRGRDGVPKGVYYQGVKVDTELQYSDNLLMFMIKGRAPQYKDRMELTGADGGPVQVQAVRSDALARLDPVALAALRQLNASMAGALPAEVVDEPAALPEAGETPAETPADGGTFARESDGLMAKE